MPYTVRGTTANFIVQYDTAMGSFGIANADAVLSTCESQYSNLVNLFSTTISTVPITVQIENATGGAFNNLTNFMSISAGNDPYQCKFLLVSELSEIFMHAQGIFWNPVNSKGEGLSRLLSQVAFPVSGDVPQLYQYNTAYFWMSNGRPDFVTVNDNSDRNPLSTGCSILFLYYLYIQLGHSLKSIISQTGTTLEAIFQAFTGISGGYAKLYIHLSFFFPISSTQDPNVFQDNPFPLTQILSRGGSPKPIAISGNSTGTNGSDGNPYFFLSSIPSLLELSKNGQLMYPGLSYNLFGQNIVFIAPYIPVVGDSLLAVDV